MAAQDPKRLKILFGVLGAVVLGALAYMVFVSGGGGDDATSTTTTTGDTSEERVDPSGGSGDPGTDVPPDTSSDDTFDVFATKNPFEPLVNVGGTPTDPTTPTTPTDPTTPTTPTTPSDPTTPTTPTTPGTPGGGGGGGGGTVEPVAPENVALLDVFVQSGVRSARVRVGSTVYTVTVGEVFATSYQVVSLDDACGQFLFGDDAFQLCQGEEVIK